MMSAMQLAGKRLSSLTQGNHQPQGGGWSDNEDDRQMSRQGRAVIKRKTMHKRLSRSLMSMSRWMRKHLHWPIREQWRKLKQKLAGHYGYYGITGNAECLEQ